MEPTRTPSLPQEDRRGFSQAALQPRLCLPPRLAASLPSQPLPPPLGRRPTAGSTFNVLNASVAVPLPPQLPQSSGGIAGDPGSSHLVNHPVVNLVRPTARYLQTPASAQSVLRSLAMNEPSTSGQSIPINTMPPSALQQSLIRTTGTCRDTNPISRFTDPAIESLMAGYRRRLLDLAPLPVSREERESRQRPDIQGTRSGCNGGQAHSEGKASTAAANGNAGSSRAMQSHIGELRSIRHGSNTAQTGNAESSDMGLMFRNASSARGSADDDEKRKMSPDRLHQESRDIDAPSDLSLKGTSAGKRDKSSARQNQNHGAQPSAILNPAIGWQVVGRVPAMQILISGQSTSQKWPSLPNSVKKRAPKFPEPYARPEAPNRAAAATTTDAAASSSRSNNNSSAKFTCPICHESLRSNDNLKTHLRVHTGERPYACAVCGADFSDRSSHAKHVNIHTGQREYACDLCGRKFTQSGNLARHKKTVHGEGGGGK